MCESPEERKTRQTKQQFEELGRFIQAFEMMVFQVRFACAQILPRTVWQQRLLNLILYHEALTARVSFDIMRAMYGEIINDPDSGFSDEERGVVDGVLLQLAKEYELLAKSRNHLLHATWHVGASDIEEGALQVHKFTTRKEGLAAQDLPATIDELRALRARCTEANKLTVALVSSFIDNPRMLLACFKKDNGKWVTTWQISVATSLQTPPQSPSPAL